MKIKIIGCLLILILFCSTFTASATYKNDVDESNSEKNWTYMLYDASDYMYNWNGILKSHKIWGRPGKNFNKVVLQDPVNGPAKIWHINERGRLKLKKCLGEVNTAESTTLSDFIVYCKDNFPADRYFLDVASHGYAWYGICLEEEINDIMTMEEMQRALTEAGGVDIMAFVSACAMAAVESVYELRDLTDVYIGSQDYSASDPRLVGPICDLLNREEPLSNIEIGEKIIETVKSLEEKSRMYPFPRATLSAMRTDGVTELVKSIDNLSKMLYDNLGGNYTDIKSVHYASQKFYDKDLLDIYDFCENYLKIDDLNVTLQNCLQEIIDGVNKTVIDEYHRDDYPVAHGLTVYFPYWGGFEWMLPRDYYSNFDLDFANDTYWDEFFVAYDALYPRVDDDGDKDYTSIQEAIDNSPEGNVIYVCNGTYNENIVINKSVFLVGEMENSPIISGDKSGDVVTITADKAKLLFFGVTNSSDEGAGVRIQANYVWVRFCDIYNNKYGIYVQDSSKNKVIGNNIFNNNYGIFLSSSDENKILHNKFKDHIRHGSFSDSNDNTWENEYLNHPNKRINIIFGTKSIGRFSIPWINIDRHRIYIL